MTTKFFTGFAILLLCILYVPGFAKQNKKPRILIFSKTAAFYHSSIPTGVRAITKLCDENNILIDTTTNSDYFVKDSLTHYTAIVFLNTTGDLFNEQQQNAFMQYIQAGGGFVGIHAASDAEYDWEWYGKLVGGYFVNHPATQDATLEVVDASHISTKHLPTIWKRKDEWYNFKFVATDLHVLIKIDEKSYTGGKNGENHPMAWCHKYNGGRAWYTELGHTNESYAEPAYLQHVLGGIKYAIGKNKKLHWH